MLKEVDWNFHSVNKIIKSSIITEQNVGLAFNYIYALQHK